MSQHGYSAAEATTGARCAPSRTVEAEVEVVVVDVKLSVVVAGAMVEDGLGNMHNKW